jgi:hypothetical protein
MAEVSLAEIIRDPNTRLGRAVLLVEEYGSEIEPLGGGFYLVPSSDGTGSYRVDYRNETCSCPDTPYHPSEACKHVFAVGIFVAKRRARSFVCEGCGERTPNRDGHEVGEDNLTFFPGDALCVPCAAAHGVL